MKKLTFFSNSLRLRAQLTATIFAVSFLFASSLSAVDVLIGQYEFTTGADQTKATSVAAGITLSDIIIGVGNIPANAISATYSNNEIITSNWGTSPNIGSAGAKKTVMFTITKDVTASEFNVARVDITFVRSVDPIGTNGKIQLNYGTTAYPTNTGMTYQSAGNVGTVAYGTYSMTETATATAPARTLIPAVLTTTPQYLAIGFGANTITETITIDKIEVWGTVSTSPALGTNKAAISIIASKDKDTSTPIVISGSNMSAATNISLVGGNVADYSIDINAIDATTLNGGAQKVIVTSKASASTMGNATATTLRIESAGATTIDIPVTATCNNLFYEDFSNYDAASTNTTIGGLNMLTPADAGFALTTGWEGNKIYSFKASSPNFGTVCIGNTAADSAYLTTPAIDLSQPFKFTFKTRNLAGITDGRYKVYLDGTELICEGQQATTALVKITSPTFKGTASSKLSFAGLKVDLNNVLIDSIVVNNSLSPDLLNVSSSKMVQFGAVQQGAEKTVNTAIQACNLVGDLSVSLKNGTDFSLVSSATVLQADATAGTTVSVKFIAPSTTTEIIDTLIISSASMTSRKIAVKATPTVTTKINTTFGQSIKPLISFVNGNLKLADLKINSLVRVYNSIGRLVVSEVAKNSNITIPLSNKGIYILRIESGTEKWTQKLIDLE